MKIKELLTDDNAVSPVIGVILMVAITVILAAVIATFVLGLGEQVQDTAPEASFSFDLDETQGSDVDTSFGEVNIDEGEGVLTIRHTGGPSIEASELRIGGSSHGEVDDPQEWASDDSVYEPNSDVSAGSTLDIAIDTSDTIDVIWESDDGTSSILADYRGPDA